MLFRVIIKVSKMASVPVWNGGSPIPSNFPWFYKYFFLCNGYRVQFRNLPFGCLMRMRRWYPDRSCAVATQFGVEELTTVRFFVL